MSAPDFVVFPTRDLLPPEWSWPDADGPVRAFNPGLLRDGAGWLLAYRIVGPDGRRRIGLCRLDANHRIVPGSPQAFTDAVRFRPHAQYPETAYHWFADPRLYRFDDRIFIYWNSGWHEPHNCQFLQEVDPGSLRPRGCPRELRLAGRRPLEKNWTFFATAEGALRAVYSIAPHRILGFSLEGEGDVEFEEAWRTDWALEEYPACHGGLRGGTPPVYAEGRYWAFVHSVHDGADGYRYAPAAYTFADTAPFAPLARPARPLQLGPAEGFVRRHPRLNPAVGEVIYPCGAAWDDARWIISYGINDEACALAIVPRGAVDATLVPR